MHRWICLIIATLLAAGCMSLGPEYEGPETDFKVPDRFDRQAETRKYVPQDRWWKAFDDQRLNRVVRQVAKNNPDIRKAAATVLETRSVLTQTRADEYPELNFSAEAARQQQSVVDPFTGNNVSVKNDSFTLSLPASYELDLWGRLSRASEAARAELMAAEANRRTVVQSLIAETVTTYLDIRSLEHRIEITRRLIDSRKRNLEIVNRRYERGLTSVLDVRQARRSLARAEAQMPGLVQSLGQSRQALKTLQGRYPKIDTKASRQIRDFEALPPVPGGLPSQLLKRRPDIRAAEARLKAACARIGVAKASRFPTISLTGSLGYTSDSLDTLIDPASELWRIAASGLQPVFDAGKRAAAQRAAEARYRQETAAYAKTVLNAFAEVEGALLTREQQIQRRKRLLNLVEEARATANIARQRYQRGLSEYVNVLEAEQALYEAELSLAENRYTIYKNRVRLHRALGGGWDRM